MVFNIIAFAVWIIPTVVVLIIAAYPGFDIPGFLGGLMVLGVGAGGYFLLMWIQNKRYDKNCNYYDFNTTTKTLTINKRCSYISEKISIADEKNYGLDYNPAKVTLTSVTIGHVTNTSLDYKNESTTVRSARTGKYYLSMRGEKIHRIELTDELVEQAKNSPEVSRYLRGNSLVLMYDGRTLTQTELSTATSLANQGLRGAAGAANIILQGAPKSELSMRECRQIRQWISGKHNGPLRTR